MTQLEALIRIGTLASASEGADYFEADFAARLRKAFRSLFGRELAMSTSSAPLKK